MNLRKWLQFEYFLSFFVANSFALTNTGTLAERHPCSRDCSAETQTPMTCGYNFTIEEFWVLSTACKSCPNVTDDCSLPDCIPADGVKRSVTVVNRMLPGPPIRVCEGDRILVDVHNLLYDQETAIHWHGISQRMSPWFDGVPGVTQCPIPPQSHFRYEFEAESSGTYSWHAESSFQKGDGLFGSLVVRKEKGREPNGHLYDLDLPEHEIVLCDWLQGPSLATFLNYGRRDSDETKPYGILVNGHGLMPGIFETVMPNDTIQSSEKPYVPLHEIRVEQGKSYRLRIISHGFMNCPIEMSIESHSMIVIGGDGRDLNQTEVSSLVIYSGERWDVVLQARHAIGSYWIKFRGLLDCDQKFHKGFQLAALNYEPLPLGTLPSHSVRNYTSVSAPLINRNAFHLNHLDLGPGRPHPPYKSVVQLNSVEEDAELLQSKPDHKFYVTSDFSDIKNLDWGDASSMTLRTVKNGPNLYAPQLNHISNMMPVSPLLMMGSEGGSQVNFCNETTLPNCTGKYCQCTHVLQVKLNSSVELILIDKGTTFDTNLPFHLHGHDFRVIATDKLSGPIGPSKIDEMDEQGLIPRRSAHAPIKDTITVPDGGYTIIRFRATNPGYWLFHCTVSFYKELGMELILEVGNHTEMPSLPPEFPTCKNYQPDPKEPPIHWKRLPTTTSTTLGPVTEDGSATNAGGQLSSTTNSTGTSEPGKSGKKNHGADFSHALASIFILNILPIFLK